MQSKNATLPKQPRPVFPKNSPADLPPASSPAEQDLSTTILDHVLLDSIAISETNKLFRDPAEMEQAALQDLVDSIREKGVIQPVLLRDIGGEKYELVCGERRYRASLIVQTLFKSRNTIPAYIRKLSDAEALDMQLTENLQRKDVHPMKEARAYKMLVEKDAKANTVSALALRFGKSEVYISSRLKLNDLQPEIVKNFEEGHLPLANALLVAKLQPAEQKEIIKRQVETNGKEKWFSSFGDFKEFINRHILRDLSAAPWKKDDADLLPSAGSCALCPKRSGSQPGLFEDMTSRNDRCADPKCYQAKLQKFTVVAALERISSHPETLFVADRSYSAEKPSAELLTLLKENGITLLHEDKWHTWNYNNWKRVQAFMCNGNEGGKMVDIWIERPKGEKATSAPGEKINVKAAIEGIKERTKRAAELDDEKIYTKTLELLETSKSWKDERKKVSSSEMALIGLMLFNHADYSVKDEIRKALKMPSSMKDEKEVEVFLRLKVEDWAWIARQIAIKQYSSPFNHDKTEGLVITLCARAHGIPVNDLINEQAEIRTKREARAKERIAALQPRKSTKNGGKK